ncbi:MAG: hypothetical protein EAZ85_03120 [Bacteroidetes bacterium]|nr:MAG: hypothetical protein EAZ85_03120 [Bacteroidota bacterium]
MEKKVIVTIQDETGNIVSEKSYSLGADTDNLSKIEASVENLRSKMLTDLTKSILVLEQSAHEKKLL